MTMLHRYKRQPAPETAPAGPNGTSALIRTSLWGVGSLVLTTALVITLVAATVLTVFGPSAPLVTVPDVKGMTADDAEARLKAARLTMKVIAEEFSPEVKEGNVISLSPYSGKLVRAGREVRVSVSRGSRMAKVPKLTGLTIAEVKDRLTDKDLQVGDETRRSSDQPADMVLAQDPAPGTMVPRKSKIDLAISGGKAFGVYDLGEHRFVFRTLKVIVPRGASLQLVQVDVSGDGDDEKSFYERLCRPGEVVNVDVYGAEGARVHVKIEDEQVFSARL